MNCFQLAKFDDVASTITIDVLFGTVCHKMSKKTTRCIAKSRLRNLKRILQSPGLQSKYETICQASGIVDRHEIENADFRALMNMYLSLLDRNSPIGLARSNRYNGENGDGFMVFATSSFKLKNILPVLGMSVNINNEEYKSLISPGNNDFSLIKCSSSGKTQLLLSPIVFNNHRCEPNVSLQVKQKSRSKQIITLEARNNIF